MEVTISLTALRALLIETSEVALKKFAIDKGESKRFISRAQADRLHGRPTIQRWIDAGFINPVRDQSGRQSWRIDLHELEATSKASNRHSFLKLKKP